MSTTPKVHILKTWPEPFHQVWSGRKHFEVRRNDRQFKVGDVLILRLWNPKSRRFGGPTVIASVSFLMQGTFGLPKKLCVMSLAEVSCFRRLTCPCESEVEDPGPHIPSCPYNDPNYDAVPW